MKETGFAIEPAQVPCKISSLFSKKKKNKNLPFLIKIIVF